MDKVLSYIGMCKLESGSVVIADPYINRIISLYEKIPRLRQRSLLIDGVKKETTTHIIFLIRKVGM